YLNYVVNNLMQSVGASRKVFEYMNREPSIQYNGHFVPHEVAGSVEFDDVTFAYPSRPDRTVLENLGFVAQPGETVALVGGSGSGKSTVLQLLQRFYEPLQGYGQVRLDGVAIDMFDHRKYHQEVSMVGQEPVLFDDTIRNNILYGCEGMFATVEEAEATMLDAAVKANVHEFVSGMEKGYDTPCGEKGGQLSGGQKQRIAIARALVRKPKVLILDEATSALDTESEALVQQALEQCTEGRTVIVVAHRLSTVKKADRIIVVKNGQTVEEGSHDVLMGIPDGVYRQLVERQNNTEGTLE
ncbi:CBN-HAF-2 protein, partial [Aphelenchoides avenae]